MALLMQWSGILVAGALLASSDVAYLSTAQRLSMLIGFALMVVEMVNASRYSKLWQDNNIQGMRALSFKSTLSLFTLVTPIILIICLYSDLIIQLFGSEYTEASLLFIILAIGQYINVLTGSVGYILNMSGHYKDFMKLYVFGGICTLILSIILTNIFSVIGAAIATSIGLISFNLAAVCVVKRRLGFWTFLP
jgi:O-antigen/teichoic acid export membrane protein